MVRIENVRDRRYSTDGAMFAVADLQVSTAAELPALGDTVGGAQVQAGSIAQIIQTGQWATLDEDGKWYAGGEEVSTEQASTLNSAALTLGKSPTLARAVADSDGEYIDLTEPEVEAIRDELEGGEEDAELL